MTEISGSLKLVTGSPAAVSQVWLRAPKGRVQGSEYVTEAPDTVPVTGGEVSFDALPGAMVMTLISHGSPTHTVKLLVPDKTSATLAECIEAAELATDGTRSALERLALEVQAELGQVPALVSDALAQDATIIDAVKQASVIREDTTVGTRVFAGDTMIFGDTGWRDITDRSDVAESGNIFLRRSGNTVSLVFTDVQLSTRSTWQNLVNIPNGFRTGIRIDHRPMVTSEVTARIMNYAVGQYRSSGHESSPDPLIFRDMWETDQTWPSSLPGTPV